MTTSQELELLRAECNKLAAERDGLLIDNRRLLVNAKQLSDFNGQLLDQIKRLSNTQLSERERDKELNAV